MTVSHDYSRGLTSEDGPDKSTQRGRWLLGEGVGQPVFVSPADAVAMLHGAGLDRATRDTVDYAAYHKGMLPRPRRVGRKPYYRRTDVLAFIDKL